MDKDDVVHIHSGILVISEIPFAATWICRLAYNEIREKQIRYHLYVECVLIYKTDLLTENRVRRMGGGINWECGINRCTLPYTK